MVPWPVYDQDNGKQKAVVNGASQGSTSAGDSKQLFKSYGEDSDRVNRAPGQLALPNEQNERIN